FAQSEDFPRCFKGELVNAQLLVVCYFHCVLLLYCSIHLTTLHSRTLSHAPTLPRSHALTLSRSHALTLSRSHAHHDLSAPWTFASASMRKLPLVTMRSVSR